MTRRFDKLLSPLDDRFDFTNRFMAAIGARTVPAGTRRFWYCFGGLAFFAAIMQGLTGMFLSFYYQPTPDEAHASVFYISTYVRYGWLIRSVHVWGARLMIALVVVHMLRVFITASYKHPREFNWVAGVMLLATTLGFMVTGELLPWDQNGYWSTQAFAALVKDTPLLGGLLGNLWVGGDSLGAAALTRFYAAHIMLLPATLTVLLLLHFLMVRKQGIARPL